MKLENTLRQMTRKLETEHAKLTRCRKAGLRGKFSVINADIKKKERSQINNLTSLFKEL